MIWHSYVIRGVHRTVAVSTLISETLARFWSAPTSFRRSARSVRRVNFGTILISIDQRIYWWKISTALISIDWLINRYTSQPVLLCDQHSSNQLFDTAFTKTSIKLRIFDVLPCSIVSKIDVSSALSVCVNQSNFALQSKFSAYISCSQHTNFLRLACPPACLPTCLPASFHQSIFRLYTCSRDSEEENVLFCKLQLTYFATSIQISDASLSLR